MRFTNKEAIEASDWFSPILVKELRQGTRSRAFVWSFLALHTVLLLLIVTALMSAASPRTFYDHSFVTGFFWTLIGIPLLIVLPAVGFGAIKKELDAKTLELIFLTRMTTLRIVFGKWFALIIQGLLFVTAILPYMILRYFLGGVNLVDELLILLFLVLGSLCLTAAGVGLSSITSKAFRVGVVIAVLFFLLQGMFISAAAVVGPAGIFTFAGTADFWGWLFLLTSVPLFIFLMLEFGAGRIAPPAENHSLGKRAAGLALLAVGAVVAFNSNWSSISLVLVAIPLLFVCGDAVNENLRSYVILLRARRARGKSFSVWLRLFFAPGWPSGVMFAALVAAIYIVILPRDPAFDHEHMLVLLCLSAAIFLPIALIRLAAPNTERSFFFFLLIQVVMICAGVSAIVISETTHLHSSTFFQFIPIPVLMLLSAGELRGAVESSTITMIVMNGLSFLILVALGAMLTRQSVRIASPDPKTRPLESTETVETAP